MYIFIFNNHTQLNCIIEFSPNFYQFIVDSLALHKERRLGSKPAFHSGYEAWNKLKAGNFSGELMNLFNQGIKNKPYQ